MKQVPFNFEQYVQDCIMPRAGNEFDVNLVAERVKKAIGEKKAISLYLGFNPVSYWGDIVVLTEEGYTFIPLEGHLALAGGVWSTIVFIRLYYAQERLSAFLAELGKKLNIEVVDRGLYAAYLDQYIEGSDQDEVDFCLEKQSLFRAKYQKQLEELRQFDSWTAYHNQGFAYRYIPSIEIEHAIDAIYRQRETLERNGYWQEARAVIDKLQVLHGYDPVRERTKEAEEAEERVRNSMQAEKALKALQAQKDYPQWN